MKGEVMAKLAGPMALSGKLYCFPCVARYKSNPDKYPFPVPAITSEPRPAPNGQFYGNFLVCWEHVTAYEPPQPKTLEEVKAEAMAELERQWQELHPGEDPPVPDEGILKPSGNLVAVSGDETDLKKFRGGLR